MTSKSKAPSMPDKPVLIIAVGRQRVGKTVFLNALAQHYGERGSQLRVWNADVLNRTNSLTTFHPNAEQPAAAAFDDIKAWIEERMSEQIEHRFDAILDVGGGETALSRLAEEVRLIETLEEEGVRPVLVHLLGADVADLDYLNRWEGSGMLSSKATVLVLNEGLLTTGRSVEFAFEKVQDHPTFKAAVLKGGACAMMPALGCMAAVTERKLGFADIAAGKRLEGQAPMSPFDRARVRRWWQAQMPAFFAEFPPAFMPRVSGKDEGGRSATQAAE